MEKLNGTAEDNNDVAKNMNNVQVDLLETVRKTLSLLPEGL